MNLENLGRLVLQKRGQRGIRAVASEIGISHATLSRIERGHLPDLENYQKICRWLGIESGASPVSAVQVPEIHCRMEKTYSPETAQALANMILAAQAFILSRREQADK